MHVPIEFDTVSPDCPYTTLVLYSSPTPTCLLMNSPTGGEVGMVLAVLPSFLELGEPRSRPWHLAWQDRRMADMDRPTSACKLPPPSLTKSAP